jgi:hypothetical protein
MLTMPRLFFHRLRQVITVPRLAWAARGLIAAFLIAQIAPPSLRVTLDSPLTVVTQRPQMCVHTRLIEEVPEFRMQQTLRAVREMGADTIVEFFPWAYVERVQGVDDWTQSDKIFKHARNQGVKVYARFGLVPEWARPNDPENPTTFNYIPEDSFDEFAAYAARFATRYQDALAGVIIWNEPNLTFEWGFQPVDPIGYTKLLSVVAPVIRDAAPDIPILAGALSPTIADSPEALNDLTYLRAMLDAGAGKYFDVLSAHTYGFGLPPNLPPSPDTLNFRRIELVRALLDEYGFTEMPIAITETGWNDHPRWAQAVTPAERITYTLGAYDIARTQWPSVEKMCLWVFRFPAPINSYPDGYTLVSTDFDFKPLYYALQEYTRGGTP